MGISREAQGDYAKEMGGMTMSNQYLLGILTITLAIVVVTTTMQIRDDYVGGMLKQVAINNIPNATDAECVYHGLRQAAFIVIVSEAGKEKMVFVRMYHWKLHIVATEPKFLDMIFGKTPKKWVE